MESKSQVEVDDFSYSGAVVGLGAVIAMRSRVALGWRGNLGIVALGGLDGLGTYFGWRYGVHQGKYEKGVKEIWETEQGVVKR